MVITIIVIVIIIIPEAELSLIRADNEKKQQILSTQIFSQADVEHINMERRALKDRIECVEAVNEEIQSVIWEMERNIGKEHEKVILSDILLT